MATSEQTSYEIEVKWNTNTLTLAVTADMTCDAFKLLLQNHTGVPVSRQKIMGAVLKSDRTLQECNITKQKKLLLVGTSEVIELAPSASGKESGASLTTKVKRVLVQGLVNLGNTCYLNSALHLLRQVQPLVEYLKPYRNTTSSNQVSNVTVPLAKLFHEMEVNQTDKAVTPMLFVMMFKSCFPQFAAVEDGHPLQQDAQEALLSLMQSLQEHMTARNAEDAALFRKLFSIQYKRTLTCSESADEPPTHSQENMLMLPCHIDAEITRMEFGLEHGMKGELDKFASGLNRNAMWTFTQEITMLPEFLIIHMVRFRWNKASGQKAKVLKPVSFPFILDVYSLCAPELKQRLEPGRDAVKKMREAEIEALRTSKVRNTERGTGDTTNAMDNNEAEVVVPNPTGQNATELGNTTGLYELCACISHKGRDANGGHYISWVKDLENQQDSWIVYDDENCGFVKSDDVQRLRGIGESHIAYVLLYRTRHPITKKLAQHV